MRSAKTLSVGVFRQTNAARIGDPFQSRGHVNAVPHQVAVVLLNHIAKVDTDAEIDPPFGRKTRIALNHSVLHFDGAAHPHRPRCGIPRCFRRRCA
jgi:hypothetical protein